MTQDLAWHDVEELVRNITDQVKAGNWQPDMVVALSRGGFVPATMIAYSLGITTLAGLPVSKDEKGLRSLSPMVELGNLSGCKVLIVDDGIVSGHLLPLAAEKVRRQNGEARTCALVSLGQCPDPDYLASTRTSMPGFPWE